MPDEINLVQCYNRGCGKKFDLCNNDEDDCCHHPGLPFFHDAYKGWSCCNKKCTDFTEFLNIKGCTLSKHSNVKPPEPEKPVPSKELEQEVIEVRAPVKAVQPQLVRPPFETQLVTLQPTIADSLLQHIHKTSERAVISDDSTVAVGTTCKNGGCNVSYEGPKTNDTSCIHHPGVPIFHEGLKFWSCCKKRTTDFNTFLNQPGCTTGTHKWKKEAPAAGTVKCRWDWHQTGDYVIVSVYAKNYHPHQSYVKLNPIRMNAKLVFPQESDASFELDLELRGVIDVDRSSASMLGTKLEVKMRKAEPGSWSKLDFARLTKEKTPEPEPLKTDETEDDLVDLTSVKTIHSIGQVNISTE